MTVLSGPTADRRHTGPRPDQIALLSRPLPAHAHFDACSQRIFTRNSNERSGYLHEGGEHWLDGGEGVKEVVAVTGHLAERLRP